MVLGSEARKERSPTPGEISGGDGIGGFRPRMMVERGGAPGLRIGFAQWTGAAGLKSRAGCGPGCCPGSNARLTTGPPRRAD
jgi:hypothetical protein